jgi:UDP-N-acetylmuramate dehydrogenase
MNPQTDVSLAPFTTFHIGGRARFFIDAHTEKDIEDAIAFAREKNLPLCALGAGSNVLVPDTGVDGVVLRMMLGEITFEKDGDDTVLIAGAGASWDAVVDAASERGIFGIENLAGIPGTLGGAAVQNIGAYGTELASAFEYAHTINRVTGEHRRITAPEASFAYRTSLFKKNRDLLIARVELRLKAGMTANLSYPDLTRRHALGEALATPVEIAQAVRKIRAQKFPQGGEDGTAGSFFKNPIISPELAHSLTERFIGLPAFPQGGGEVKISLAWLLDHTLGLKGHAVGSVRLYEKQPLVIVARPGATAAEIDAFANDIAKRVREITDIIIEREVETFSDKHFS